MPMGMQNPMEAWIQEKTGGRDIREYQLEKIKHTLAYVFENSRFYKSLYKGMNVCQIKSFEDFQGLPFVTSRDLIENGMGMLCVPQNEIERIVTLYTSGTSGDPKRVYFTKHDQDLTVDFFHRGMQCLIDRRDRFMILLPYETPGSVGDLLSLGLVRLGCEIYPYGLIGDYKDAGKFMAQNKITSLVGNPLQVLKLAEFSRAYGFEIKLDSILLSTDYVPDAVVKRLSDLWGCRVYEHYGMTEMCFGGGVFCGYLNGYHMREADLYFEIISENGHILSCGEYGEIVFTTLSRTGMPLVRYRTGDFGRFKTERCPCSEKLVLMEKIKRRMDGGIATPNGGLFYICDFDEIIFAQNGVTDYHLEWESGKLGVHISIVSGNAEEIRKTVCENIYDGSGFKPEVTVQKEVNEPQGKLIKRKIV